MTPSQMLETLQSDLAPTPAKKSKRKSFDPAGDKPLISVHLLDLSAFEDLCQRFETIMKPENYEQLTIIEQSNLFHLYWALSLDVHRWSHVQVPNIKEKLNYIKKLDKLGFPKLIDLIHSAEPTAAEYPKQIRSFHQTRLKINGTLFAYVHNLIEDKTYSLNEIVENNPFFTNQQIAASMAEAQNRKPSSGSNGASAESQINQIIHSNLGIPYEHLKADPNAFYIDPETGLELDCPLRNLTIETDGHHHIDADQGINNISHSLKSHLLREKGWTRISLELDAIEEDPDGLEKCKAKVHSLIGLLKIDTSVAFFNEYNQLMALRPDIQKEIRDLIAKADDQTDLTKLATLMELDKQIMDISEKRVLERFLTDPASKPIQDLYNKIISDKHAKDNLHNQIECIKRQAVGPVSRLLEAYRKQYKSLESDLNKASKEEQRTFYTESLKKVMQNIKEQELRAKIVILPSEVKAQIEVLQNQINQLNAVIAADEGQLKPLVNAKLPTIALIQQRLDIEAAFNKVKARDVDGDLEMRIMIPSKEASLARSMGSPLVFSMGMRSPTARSKPQPHINLKPTQFATRDNAELSIIQNSEARKNTINVKRARHSY